MMATLPPPPPPPPDLPAAPRRRSFSGSFRRRTTSLQSTESQAPRSASRSIIFNGGRATATDSESGGLRPPKPSKSSKPPRTSVTQKLRCSSLLRGGNSGQDNSPAPSSPTLDGSTDIEQTPVPSHGRKISLDVRHVLGNLRNRSRASSRVDVSTSATLGHDDGETQGPISPGWELVDSPLRTSFSGGSTRGSETTSTRGTSLASQPSLLSASIPPVIPPLRLVCSPSTPQQLRSSSYEQTPSASPSSQLPPTPTHNIGAGVSPQPSTSSSRTSDENSPPQLSLPPLQASTVEFVDSSTTTDRAVSQRLRSMPRLASYGPDVTTGLGITQQVDDSDDQESDDDDGDDGDNDEDATTQPTTEVDGDDDVAVYASTDEGPSRPNVGQRIPSGPIAGPNVVPSPSGSSDSGRRITREGAPSTLDGIHSTHSPRAGPSTMSAATPRTNPEWVSFPTVTPTPMVSNRVPPSTTITGSYFDIPTKSHTPLTRPPQTPGERARALFLSPASSMSPPPPMPAMTPRITESPERPGTARLRSQSVMLNLGAAEAPDPSIIRSPFGPEVIMSPGPPSHPGTPAVEKAGRMRRQSMYELRSGSPPPYRHSFLDPRGRFHEILPREDEGREGLPAYTCAVHLEGWMPRKMEFKSPGVQAKDRAWKRQYVVLHGTMIRIYRSDPHQQPISGEQDSYLLEAIPPTRTPSNTGAGQTLPGSASTTAATAELSERAKRRREGSRPLHFHEGQYGAAPSASLREVAASHLPSHHNSLVRVYSLQHAESGLAADYLKRKHVVRVRAEGEQFLLAAKDDRGVIDLIEALQAATNVSLDLDQRTLPKFITLPRRRRRRRRPDEAGGARAGDGGAGGGTSGNTNQASNRPRPNEAGHANGSAAGASTAAGPASESTRDRIGDMLSEEQDAYMGRPTGVAM